MSPPCSRRARLSLRPAPTAHPRAVPPRTAAPVSPDTSGGAARQCSAGTCGSPPAGATAAGIENKGPGGGYVSNYKIAPPPSKGGSQTTILPPAQGGGGGGMMRVGGPNSPSRARHMKPGLLRSSSLQPVRPVEREVGVSGALRKRVASNPFKQQSTALPKTTFGGGAGVGGVGGAGAGRVRGRGSGGGMAGPRVGFGGESLW